jgi:hypothetical protein
MVNFIFILQIYLLILIALIIFPVCIAIKRFDTVYLILLIGT